MIYNIRVKEGIYSVKTPSHKKWGLIISMSKKFISNR